MASRGGNRQAPISRNAPPKVAAGKAQEPPAAAPAPKAQEPPAAAPAPKAEVAPAPEPAPAQPAVAGTKAEEPDEVDEADDADELDGLVDDGEDDGGSDDEDDGDAPKKSRVQLVSVLKLSISPARVATHTKHNLGDKETEDAIKALRAQLKALAASGQGESGEASALREEVAKLSKNLVRISSETPIAAAVVLDDAVKELLRHGMSEAIAEGKKMVEVAHLHSGQVAGLLFLPLYDKCEAWKGFSEEKEEAFKKEKTATNKLAKEEKEARKAAGGGRGRGGRGGRGKAAAPAGGEAEHTKTTFNTYVESALKTVKKDEPFKNMRVSGRVREHISDLVTQVMARLSSLARIIVHTVMVVRTMNSDHIKAVITLLMSDAGRHHDQIAQVLSHIDEKLAIYHEHVAGEKEKKAAALDEEKRAEIERKKHEAELARKKKQAENAEKRVEETRKKAENLRAEITKLEN